MMNKQRVVITGMGVVAPNGVGLEAFEKALRMGTSGIRFIPQLAELNFACRVGGIPPLIEGIKEQYFSHLTLRTLKSSGVIYGSIAGQMAWKDAGLQPAAKEEPDWDSGCVFGSGMTGIEALRDGVLEVDAGRVKRLGSRLIEQAMASSISAHLGGALGLGNQVSTNASACCTGTEALILAADRIRSGKAKRMLAGGCDSHGPYVWGGFDSMRVLCRRYNENPEQASRPMSTTAAGFVPGSGAGALVVESLDSALKRGARIYAEYLGGFANSGGQRGNGTMTAPNVEGMKRCIWAAMEDAGVSPHQIDALNGHLTATRGDSLEVQAWSEALNRGEKDFPYIQSTKSMIGHCLSAAGAIESVATVLQLNKGFLHASINSEDLHEGVSNRIHPSRVVRETLSGIDLRVMAKASFGFGDVNACVVLGRWE
ncbi:MAG: beta-ketoacyl-[acyl-carrier-protein] synthase family protein [Bacteroidota bacterium]